MSNIKELIRQEIERRKKEFMYDSLSSTIGRYYEDRDLLAFIDSLPEEKPSEDLEEAANEYATKWHENPDGTAWKPYFEVSAIRAFIAGAEWQKMEAGRGYDSRDLYEAYEQGRFEQKEQMMKAAVEGEIGYWNQRGLSIRLDQSLEKLGYDVDTRVKIIIVKQ